MEFICPEAHFCAKSLSNRVFFITKALIISIFTLLIISTAFSQRANAGQVSLAWDADTSTGVTGYKLLYGTASGNYTNSIDVGNTTSYTVSNLADGQTYYFVATAYDSQGNQSGYSNEASKTLLAQVSTYTITATAGTGGTISPSTVSVTSGGSTTFTITPNTGYQIANVTVDGVVVGSMNTYTFSNVTTNHTISATFAPIAAPVSTYTITATAGTGGTISPSTVSVTSGGSTTFTITPNTGYQIASVTVDGVVVGSMNTYTFSNVTTNHTISATFAPITLTTSSYTITASATSGGKISPLGTVTVNAGSAKTYTISANRNFIIYNVLVDGVSKGAINSYTFSNITANHSIQASFLHK